MKRGELYRVAHPSVQDPNPKETHLIIGVLPSRVSGNSNKNIPAKALVIHRGTADAPSLESNRRYAIRDKPSAIRLKLTAIGMKTRATGLP